MVAIDHYASAGFALELLSASKYHKQHLVGSYFHTEVLPALHAGQCRFYLTSENIPTAMVTWAWLSEDVEKDIHTSGRALKYDEWNCGDRLFFNDWITPYNNIKEVLKDMTHNLFPHEIATSLRRRPDGSVRRINRWVGVEKAKDLRVEQTA